MRRSGPPPEPRIDARPLLRAVAAEGVSTDRYPQRIQQAFYRARREGTITVSAADQLAVVMARAHPCELWGDAWWDTSRD